MNGSRFRHRDFRTGALDIRDGPSGLPLKDSTFSPKNPVSQPNWFSPPQGKDVQMMEVAGELREGFKLE